MGKTNRAEKGDYDREEKIDNDGIRSGRKGKY